MSSPIPSNSPTKLTGPSVPNFEPATNLCVRAPSISPPPPFLYSGINILTSTPVHPFEAHPHPPPIAFPHPPSLLPPTNLMKSPPPPPSSAPLPGQMSYLSACLKAALNRESALCSVLGAVNQENALFRNHVAELHHDSAFLRGQIKGLEQQLGEKCQAYDVVVGQGYEMLGVIKVMDQEMVGLRRDLMKTKVEVGITRRSGQIKEAEKTDEKVDEKVEEKMDEKVGDEIKETAEELNQKDCGGAGASEVNVKEEEVTSEKGSVELAHEWDALMAELEVEF